MKILNIDHLGIAVGSIADEKPRIGAGGARIAFLHPQASHGILVELCERDH